MWTTAFQNTLPQLGTVAEAENEESIKAHVLGIQQSPNLHQVFKEAVGERSSRLDNLLAEYRTGLDDLLTKYEASVAEIKKSANDLLDKAMIPVYDAASDQTGMVFRFNALKRYTNKFRRIWRHDEAVCCHGRGCATDSIQNLSSR